jgi:hypothetical protein
VVRIALLLHLDERLAHASLLLEHLVEATHHLLEVRHVVTVTTTDPASRSSAHFSSLASLDAGEDLRERAAVDARDGPLAVRRIRQSEERAMEPLVEDAVAVAIEP